METIGAAKFKEQCLALLERLPPAGLIITKHGKPVARVTPYPQDTADLLGILRDIIEIHGDIITTGTAWDADAQP